MGGNFIFLLLVLCSFFKSKVAYHKFLQILAFDYLGFFSPILRDSIDYAWLIIIRRRDLANLYHHAYVKEMNIF